MISGAVPVLIFLVNLFACRIEVFSGHVAKGDDSRVSLAKKTAQDAAPLRTCADTADSNAVARRSVAFSPQRGSRDNGRKRADRDRGNQVVSDEMTAAKR